MANLTRNFTAGRMNKVVDERLIPNGEYIDALNIRMGSTENSEIGVIENTKGNLPLTQLQFNNIPLSSSAKCIGAFEDGTNETLYWFVHDGGFLSSPTGKLDLICSYNVKSNILTYHIISINDGSQQNTTLNFNENYLITGVNIIENLLFFTDNYNQPRKININNNYANPYISSGVYVDGFSEESILVIKKPPVTSPQVQPISTGGQENFMDTRFICFGYRYQYEDGEYSAISQFSEPSFIPKQFNFDPTSFLNDGMTNSCNHAIVTFNTGGPLVKSIDLLFKEANSPIIKVIEKLNKKDLGYTDNAEVSYTFGNSKIFTILPESEILRLYDNVPLAAKAQTIMGNRVVYGNYIEGYDMIDKNGNPVNLSYYTQLISEEIGFQPIEDSTASGIYNINGSKTVPNSIIYIDLNGKELKQGASINIEIRLTHNDFSVSPVGTVEPEQVTDNINLSFTYILPSDFNSVYELATSDKFVEAIGTIDNIAPVYSTTEPTSCDGITLTDQFNCAIPNVLGTFTKYASGISADGQPIEIIADPTSTEIGLQLPAVRFVDDVVTPTENLYEFYSINFAEASYQEIANPTSLHSNRGYEISIIYMDDFGRSTTALVSKNNTEHVPCGYSSNKNSIRVTIPSSPNKQIAPYWATRYKFAIKPDSEGYDTIYCNQFFADPDSNSVWFLLEGENSRKIEEGDRLIVKADTSGPLQTCAYATVLEKVAQPENFIEVPSPIDPEQFITVPAGTYMKINPNSFSTEKDEDAYVNPGLISVVERSGDEYPFLAYPMNLKRVAGYDPANPGWIYQDYSVPAGSRITLYIKFERRGPGAGNGACERRIYTLEKNLISSRSYDSMYEWFIGEDIQSVLNDGSSDVGSGGCPIGNDFDPSLATSAGNPNLSFLNEQICNNQFRFHRNTDTNQLTLMMSGTETCTGVDFGGKKNSKIYAKIEVLRAADTLVFETEPQDALPDVFFESSESFAITADGEHEGNVQSQDFGLNLPAIIDTDFYNCYSFGNGVESYKILDSIVGDSFNLGNRVTTTSSQDYRRVNRFADLTYSGIYNTESNVNKLNEFNSGLLNYKNLEVLFGPVQVLYARETDILVLQEDKISYVLAGKNLLSDAAAGGAITSVPEVLGTQIARMEEYGISKNPESFASWGYDKYFTDAKRGAVIQLRGSAYSNEALKVVSELGMRTWFRDLFNDSFDTQKIGGYDPYMNEYVLSSNDIQVPAPEECINCGITRTISLSNGSAVEYCVEFTPIVGEVNVDYVLPTESSVNIEVIYNGNTYSTGTVSGPGTLSFDKTSNSVNTAVVRINPYSTTNIGITVGCPTADEITVVNVTVTSSEDSGQFIHNEYLYQDVEYISPLQSEDVEFASGSSSLLISQYQQYTGPSGFGSIPVAGSTVTMFSNKFGFDNFVFNPDVNKFRYIRTDTYYPNTEEGISSLIADSLVASPIDTSGAPNIYSADFTMPSTGAYLYMIWDYRKSTPATLCYSTLGIGDACCGCLE